MVNVAPFGPRNSGSNPGWFASRIQIENWVSQIIQAKIWLITSCNPRYDGE